VSGGAPVDARLPDERRGSAGSLGRDWWLRTLLVLRSPRPVFAALRDNSSRAAEAREEPVLLIVMLAGIASVLSTPTAGRLMDDQEYDALLVAVWAFIGGGLYGVFAYWAFGGALYGGARALGSAGSYRRARHLLAFASVPIALSLVLWPVKIALYGDDVFRSGGADEGGGEAAFGVVSAGFLVWAIALLLIGVRAVNGWTWPRSAAAIGIAALLPAAIVLALSSA
jgi:hypothetical protein